jgi:hypothetical protein
MFSIISSLSRFFIRISVVSTNVSRHFMTVIVSLFVNENNDLCVNNPTYPTIELYYDIDFLE